MRLCRLIADGGLWIKARTLAETSAISVSPQVVPFFIPSAEDKEWPSLYAIDHAEEADFVAAALRYNEGKIAACHFAGVDTSALDAADIVWKKTPGETYHPLANDKHYEMHIPDMQTLVEVVLLFVQGEYFSVEHSRVTKTLQVSAAEGKIDLEAVLEKINGNVATRTLELAKSKHLTLKSAA